VIKIRVAEPKQRNTWFGEQAYRWIIPIYQP